MFLDKHKLMYPFTAVTFSHTWMKLKLVGKAKDTATVKRYCHIVLNIIHIKPIFTVVHKNSVMFCTFFS